MEIKLAKLNENMENQLKSFIYNSPDLPDIYKLIDNDFYKTVTELENYSNGLNLPENFVPYTVFYALDENTKDIVGQVSVRHSLNEYLRFRGGHIGYYVTPSSRKAGVGTKILEQTLKFCREINLDKVLITCNEDNIGSNKIILNNRGIFESTEIDPDGIFFNRYWISLI